MMTQNTSPIQIEWFHYLEGDKTKLNWYLLELAVEYYDFIQRSSALEDYRNQYGQRHIAQYRAYYARRMKKSLLNALRGRTKNFIFYEGYVTDLYPRHEKRLNGILNELAMEAFENLRTVCDVCKQRCLSDYRAKSEYFDQYKN